ncbi:MAG: YitT family protein [Herbinix sp.]|nr:YitT family protein [Herbinix sp.]
MNSYSKRATLFKYLGQLFGILLFAASLNLIIVPLNLYSGNLTGIAQILKTILIENLNVRLPDGIDLLGIIMFLYNVPLFILSYTKLSKSFFYCTLVCVTIQSLAIALIPIPKTPILDDPLTACIIGGIISGYGVGTTLKYGGSGGGTDVIGLYCAKKYPSFSVGKISIFLSSIVFIYCAIRYDIEIVVYSAIFLCVGAITLDRVHEQNIKTSAMIYTKVEAIDECIISTLGRGATRWFGEGCYTHEHTYIYMTVISKYEVGKLKRLVLEKDPDAFIIFNNRLDVTGNFIKRF